MKETKLILILCNLAFVLFLFFSSFCFTYFALNSVYSNVKTPSKSSNYTIKNSIENSNSQRNSYTCSKRQDLNQFTRIKIKETSKEDQNSFIKKEHKLMTFSNNNESSGKAEFSGLVSNSIELTQNYKQTDVSKDEVFKQMNSIALLQNEECISISDSLSSSFSLNSNSFSYSNKIPLAFYNVKSLYYISLIIQISFAFGLSGLFINRRVLKLGIY